MSIIAKKANPAEIDTPTTGKVSLYVDCNDGKIKIKDSNGCVNSLMYYCGECQKQYSNVDLLIVGGGGGGSGLGGLSGCAGGGGGGAGGLIRLDNYCLSGTSNTVVVGAGGAVNYNGGNSCFGTLIAYGGGYGGWLKAGGSGGSGGGGGSGYAGGTSYTQFPIFQGCGGETSASRSNGGRGGKGGGWNASEGVTTDITGSTMCIGIGGKPACNCATPNYYGSGGNGSCQWQGSSSSSSFCGTAGKQGIVVVRYKTDGSMGIKCATGGTITCCNGYTIHTFTSSGNFCVTCKTSFYPVV